jgi:acyl-CoA reductase-like NAD-dependent aldehyde dehydrogenase
LELDKDLKARQEARRLAVAAEQAQAQLAAMSQQQLDRICEGVAKAFCAAAPELAAMAVQETGFGNTEDKIIKNAFASRTVMAAIRDMKIVGVLKEAPLE